MLPRSVQDLRRLRPLPALLAAQQLLQENDHQNEVGQCQAYGLSLGGSWRQRQSHLELCDISLPGLQDSLTGLLSSVQQQAIQNQVRQFLPDPDFRNCGKAG